MGSNVVMSFHPPTVVFPVPSYLPAPFSFANEFAAARFGDRRLNSRACRITESAVGNPECSIPKMLGNASQAEGLYRFVANESITAEALSKSHNDQTIVRAGAGARACCSQVDSVHSSPAGIGRAVVKP